MKTLKGVIATTTGKGEVVSDESDLHIYPWYFVLSSKLYNIVNRDAVGGNLAFPEAALVLKVKKATYLPDTISASLSFPLARIRTAIEKYTLKDAATPEISFPQAILRASLVDTEISDATEANIEFPEALVRHALIKIDYTPDATEASIEFPEATLYEPN